MKENPLLEKLINAIGEYESEHATPVKDYGLLVLCRKQMFEAYHVILAVQEKP